MTEPVNPAAESVAFDTESTWEILRTACAEAGLRCVDAELLRLGENALYRLMQLGVVVRIARTMKYWEDAKREVSVARWLSSRGFPAAQALDGPQPIAANGHPVTFWHHIKGQPGTKADIQKLGQVLRRLHAIPAPTEFTLPSENILGRVKRRIEVAPVPDADKSFLLRRCEELDRELRALKFPLPPGPTHGDAHIKNLMIHNDKPGAY